MLNAKDKSFAAKFLADTQTSEENLKGPSHERGFAAQASNLRVWTKSGKLAAGLSWSTYVTDEWTEEGTSERLTLVFSSRYVVLRGRHLLAFLRQIDEGRLKHIVEVDDLRAEQMRAENADIRGEGKKIPIVTHVEIGPGIGELLGALKGE